MAKGKEKKLELTKKILTKTMKELDFCMMTTGARGHLHSRPMSNNRNVDWDGNTWFFAYADSSQVKELKRDKSVILNPFISLTLLNSFYENFHCFGA